MSNTRIITALAAFVAAFIFSAGLVRIILPAPVVSYVYTEGPRVGAYASSIEEFVSRDEMNGTTRLDYRNSEAYAQAVMNYWKTSSSMDASRFPQDFQNAWRTHMQAWKSYADYLEVKQNSKSSYSCGLEKQYNAEINRTWEEVLRIGRSYGAKVY